MPSFSFHWSHERARQHVYTEMDFEFPKRSKENGAEQAANMPGSKSYMHQEVPYSTRAPQQGMRHVGLCQDPRILEAIAYCLTHVR